MKKLTIFTLTVVMLFAAAVPCFAVQIIGQVLSTDIRAYINGAEIPAYNIDGKLAVVVSDLNNYGFKTQYNNTLRKSSVTRNPSATNFTSVTSNASGLPIGTRVMDVYRSDITVELDGRPVEAFNVDNRMAIYFAELKGYGTYSYDNNKRTSNLTLDKNYTPKPVYLLDVVKPYLSKKYNEYGTREYFMMGGTQRYNGFVLDGYSPSIAASVETGFAYFNLNGQYTKLSGVMGYVDGKVHNDGWDVTIYGDDRILSTQRIDPGSLPKAFSLDVSGVAKLEFRVNRDKSGLTCAFGFADLTLTGGGSGIQSKIHTSQLGKAIIFVDALQSYNASRKYNVFGTRDYVMMGGAQRYNGFVLDSYSPSIVASVETGFAYFNLNGQYKKFSGLMGFVDDKVHSDSWDVTIYGDDRILLTQRFEQGDLPKEFLIDVSGVSKLEFRVNREKSGLTCSFSFAELMLYQ